jgi:hypothetical protein
MHPLPTCPTSPPSHQARSLHGMMPHARPTASPSLTHTHTRTHTVHPSPHRPTNGLIPDRRRRVPRSCAPTGCLRHDWFRALCSRRSWKQSRSSSSLLTLTAAPTALREWPLPQTSPHLRRASWAIARGATCCFTVNHTSTSSCVHMSTPCPTVASLASPPIAGHPMSILSLGQCHPIFFGNGHWPWPVG